MTRFAYRIPSGVNIVPDQKRSMLSTQSDGQIIVDQQMLTLWKYAHGRSIDEIISKFTGVNVDPIQVRVGLACLAEAGLLVRDGDPSSTTNNQLIRGSLVSIIIVGFNSREWLELCLPSLQSQDYAPVETILVDNGSTDGTSRWVEMSFPEISLLRLENAQSLATAINLGIQEAKGVFYILLNPDVQLDQGAIRRLVSVAQDNSVCAAVTSKLKFMYTPQFLNGIGNLVGATGYGIDCALGHLDLGQFDSWSEAPSACFAASLIPAKAWEEIGPLDEHFPLYFEDSEWCYRARLYGYQIKVSHHSLVFHAMGGRTSDVETVDLDAWKQRCVVFGRLRFATRILSIWYLLHFLFNYILEDCLGFILSLVKGQWDSTKSYLGAWGEYVRSLPELWHDRNIIQARRNISDSELFEVQKEIPVPLVWRGLPQLTWDIVQTHYFPYLVSGKTREIQEFTGFTDVESYSHALRQNKWSFVRAIRIWKGEGFAALLHRMGRDIQWFLMKP